MSTPTSRPPQEPDENGLTAADRMSMGQHAAPRPYPPAPTGQQPTVAAPGSPPPQGYTGDSQQPPTGQTPPPPPPGAAPGAAPSPAPTAQAPQAESSAPAPTAGGPTAPAPTRAERREGERSSADDPDLPEPPSKPGAARHLVGILLGLVLTPVALLLVGIGTARLAEDAGTADMGTDTLGTTLLIIGLVLLAVIVLLGIWSPSVPVVGGLVWGIGLGVAYLVIPGTMEDSVEASLGNREVPAAVDQLAESAMSGQLVLIGVLLLAAGFATARARRAGRRWAEGVASAERARFEARAAERDRIRYEADARARGTQA